VTARPWLRTAVFAVLAGAILADARPASAAPAEIDRPVHPAPFAVSATDSVVYKVFVANGNQVGITLTNYGFFGNNFVSRSPSLEYPISSGFEHLVRGGLWVGAVAQDTLDFFTGVTTGSVDGSQGTSAQQSTEFTPAGSAISVRSTLKRNSHYDPNAISELDVISSFSDNPAKRALGNNEDHRPLNLLVRQETYSWSFAELQNFIILRFVIKNIGPPLQNVWVGWYSELASGNKNAYGTWPPSTASGPGSWYNKKWLQYDGDIRLLREHYCGTAPPPDLCGGDYAPYWAGIALLGTRPDLLVAGPESLSTKRITATAWDWAPGSALRDQDTERYAIMSMGAIDSAVTTGALWPPSDPVELLSVGPFAEIDPGDSVEVTFAIVGGPGTEDPSPIRTFTQVAQKAFDNNFIVPIPPPSPGMRIVAHDHALDFLWERSPEFTPDVTSPDTLDWEGYRLYLGETRGGMKLVKEWDKKDGRFYDTGLDEIALGKDSVQIDQTWYHYKYTVGNLKDGFKYFGAVTSFDEGIIDTGSLESGTTQNLTEAIPAPAPGERDGHKVTVFPNPYRVEAAWDQGPTHLVRDHYLWFANLPKQCTLRIYTLAGDLVFETPFDGDTYAGQGARGIYNPAQEQDIAAPTMSGSMFGWNMITREGQATATGLYVFSVEDKATGKRELGKFLIVKSDREQ